MTKLLRLWRQRAIFEETAHVLDPIDAFIARVEKGQSSRPSAGPGPGAHSPVSPRVGDKRRLPPPQDPRGRRGAGPPLPPPPPAPPTAQAPHHHHRRGGRGGGAGASSPRGGAGGGGKASETGGPPRTLEFIVAVDREMKALLERLCGEIGGGGGGGGRPMGIEELARRNPAAAEQLKRAAEAAVVGRMVREAEQVVAVRFCVFALAWAGLD